MEALEALRTRRSVRRYSQKKISRELLGKIVDVARYAPTGGNSQRWKIVLVDEPELLDNVFQTLSWLPSVGKPEEGARPTAYMVIISDKEANIADCASLSTYITLAAHDRGLGSCWFGSVRRTELMKLLNIPEEYSIEFVVSLGYPDEKFEIVESEEDTTVSRDGGTTVVPKLKCEKILQHNSFDD
jgi:nitroreductase